MKINILIPIDFKIGSLNTLKIALSGKPNQSCNIVLMYAEHLSHSITDLLFYSPHKSIRANKSPAFDEAIKILKNRFESQIDILRIELFHGKNVQSFINFHSAHRIDEIYIPATYKLNPGKHGFDPIHLIKKSGLPQSEINWETDFNGNDNDQINSLFK